MEPIQIPLLNAEQLEVARKPPPARSEWWVILAAHRAGYWSLRKSEWSTREKAEEAALAMDSCWVYYQLVRIPGLEKA